LNDHETFSSRVPAPQWFLFFDPPEHTKLRALISRAFTPRMVARLEPRISELSRELLDQTIERGEMDLAADWPQYKQWSDVILRLSYTRSGGEEAERAARDFRAVTVEMSAYLADMIQQRRSAPRDDLLTHLIEAEVDGQRLSQQEILGFF
jgi:cytochrome P450